MMMDCPRCGFSQPKDRYCANCGLDVDRALSKPKPLWIRVLQNPNFHLSLIGILMVLVIGYILYSRSSFVSREVHNMLGTPVSSRNAADPDESAPAEDTTEAASEPAAAPEPAPETVAMAAAPGTAPAEAPPLPDPKQLTLGFWEIARETLASVIPTAEKLGESTEGRVYLFKDGGKVADALRAGSRRLGLPRQLPLQNGSQLTIVTPPSTPEPFQFGLALQITRWENKEAQLRWDSQLVLSQPETPAEMASQTPMVKAVVESTLTGTATLGPQGVILVLFDPNNRHPRPEYLAKAGQGPWSIFSSDDFRNGITDWVVLIQLK